MKPNNDSDERLRNVICGWGNIDVTSSDPLITTEKEYKLSHPLRMLSSNLYSMNQDSDDHSLVYVISDIFGECVKIGEARDANKRLLQLQAGNPRRLYIHRAFWFRNKQYAQLVENQTHRAAPSRGFQRLQSEWFRCKPSQAHSLILSIIDDIPIAYFGVVTPGKAHWGHSEHESAA